MAKEFRSASAFKMSLEARLRAKAAERGVPLQTLRLKFVMERLLARLFRSPVTPWVLKGGFAMDLRYRPRARTTKDIDLSVPGGLPSEIHGQLQGAAEADLGDHLMFHIGEPRSELTNAPKGGGRFPCETVMLGKTYASFHLDVGIGDAALGEPEELSGDDFLDFAGIDPAVIFAIPTAQQFAEKIHAYTFPWSGRVNTRSKDLVDLLLLIERGPPDVEQIRDSVSATFSTRGTHSIPESLSEPPEAWKEEFSKMAAEASLSTEALAEAYELLKGFWERHSLGG